MKAEQDNLAVKFLLGKLTEEEQTEIEKEYFQDTNQFENILIAENDLIDAYVKGELAPVDRKLFESRLMLNARQRQRVEFAKTLVKYASDQPLVELHSLPAKSKWSSIFNRLFSARPFLSFSFAAAALILFFGVLWLTINNNSPHVPRPDELASATPSKEFETPEPAADHRSEEKPTAQNEAGKTENLRTELPAKPNQNQSSKSRIEQKEKRAPVISTIILPLGTTRGGAAKTFALPAKTDVVNLQLKFEEGDFKTFFVVLETVEGQQIWSRKIRQPAKNEKVVIAEVPARFFRKGDYIIILKGLNANGIYESVGDYAFTIDR